MGSIQTNLSVLSGIKYNSFASTGKVPNKKSISNYSVKNEIVQFTVQIRTDTKQNLSDQNAIFHFSQLSKELKTSLVYNNTPISELSVDEARDLISDDGYFGIEKTSQRIIDFAIKGAGNDIDRLRAGREGVLRGMAEAEKAWGENLPGISYGTLEKSLGAIDKKIRELGGSVLDLST
ncbi:MAG: hydrogenase-4 component G [Desulfobacula sp.]|nr:hydrogenase-4 component G [Desulfobacula sp.]